MKYVWSKKLRQYNSYLLYGNSFELASSEKDLMIRLLLFILFCFPAFSGIAQKSKPNGKIGYVKRYDYRIEINIWNDPRGSGSTYLLDNSGMQFYDAKAIESDHIKPMTLYCITKKYLTGISDTVTIKFAKEDSDSLYNLTRQFFTTFHLNNIDTLINDSTIHTISDDAQATVAFSLGERKITAEIYSISNPLVSTKDFIRLLKYVREHFMNKKQNSR